MAHKIVTEYSILQWNCRSITKNLNELIQFISLHNFNIVLASIFPQSQTSTLLLSLTIIPIHQKSTPLSMFDLTFHLLKSLPQFLIQSKIRTLVLSPPK